MTDQAEYSPPEPDTPITSYGLRFAADFRAAMIPAELMPALDELEAILDNWLDWNGSAVWENERLDPSALEATQEHVIDRRVRELVSEPTDKPILVVTMSVGSEDRLFILDGHHRAAAAKLRGVNVAAVVVRVTP